MVVGEVWSYEVAEKAIRDDGMDYISSAGERTRSQFLLVKYEHSVRARKVLNHFHDVYRPSIRKNSRRIRPQKS
jgi:hypothetical protein